VKVRPEGSILQYLERRSGRHGEEAPLTHDRNSDRYDEAREEIFELLMRSATFRAGILDFHTTYAMFYPVLWRDLGSFCGGVCDQLYRRIFLNTRSLDFLGVPNVVQTLAHEYRHAWQQSRKLARHLFDSLEEQIVHTRMVEGDAVAFQLTVAWELREAGRPDIWDGALSLMLREYPECTKAFMAAIAADPLSVATGRAQNAVLSAWLHNRQRSIGYEATKSAAFRHFNRLSRREKSLQRSLVVEAYAFEERLFKMPFAVVEDGRDIGIRQRAQYGRLTHIERSRLQSITLPASRLRAARLNLICRS